jgi:hypothetical protein
MDNFTIDFAYDGVLYKALVTPQQGAGSYKVQLESENQENFVEIIATAPALGTDHWIFRCPDDEEPSTHYDQELLEEIGEAIERNETDH